MCLNSITIRSPGYSARHASGMLVLLTSDCLMHSHLNDTCPVSLFKFEPHMMSVKNILSPFSTIPSFHNSLDRSRQSWEG